MEVFEIASHWRDNHEEYVYIYLVNVMPERADEEFAFFVEKWKIRMWIFDVVFWKVTDVDRNERGLNIFVF
jgi:hypothetical protein